MALFRIPQDLEQRVILEDHGNCKRQEEMDPRCQQQVISTGPYRLIRHPMYAGASNRVARHAGCAWIVVGRAIALALIAVIVVRLFDEERYLSSSLPGYADYCRKVKFRLIPMLW